MAKYLLSRTGTQYRFVLKATNGQTILTSELYDTKGGATNGIASVKTNASNDARYMRKTARDGSPMFNLKGANGEIIGTSEMYSSEAAREGGITAVKTHGPAATTDDQT